MGTAGAIVGGSIVGGLLQRDAARKQARAQERAARAQLSAEERARAEEIKFRRETREQALEFAKFRPEEIAAIERATELNEQDLARKERLLDSVDPALMNAGQQALELLQGQEAAILDPVRRQRQEQKQALEERLQRQLGTGFRTTTAGLQALNDFDEGTDRLLAQAQQDSISQLLGVSQNVRNIANLGSNITNAQNLAQLQGTEARRQVAAVTQTPLVPQAQITNAGAPFVGDALRAQADQQFLGQLTGSLTLGALLSSQNPSGQGSVAGTVGGLAAGGPGFSGGLLGAGALA